MKAIAALGLVASAAGACVHYEPTDAIQGPLAAIAVAKKACSGIGFPGMSTHWTAVREGDTWTVCTYEIDWRGKYCEGPMVTLDTHTGHAGPCEIGVFA